MIGAFDGRERPRAAATSRHGEQDCSIGAQPLVRQSMADHGGAAGKMSGVSTPSSCTVPSAVTPPRRWPVVPGAALAGRGAVLLSVLCAGAGPALASCADPPGPGVDWTACEKVRLVLRGANFAGARLAGADFSGTDLQRANLAGADLTHASVDRARLAGADLSRARLLQLNAYRANMAGARLVGADLTKAELTRTNLSSADLSHANLRKAELQRANLQGSKLDDANLSGADLARTNLRGASFVGARMALARTFRTRLEGVDLSSVTGLTPAQLQSACGDATTRLPSGFMQPANWPCGREE